MRDMVVVTPSTGSYAEGIFPRFSHIRLSIGTDKASYKCSCDVKTPFSSRIRNSRHLVKQSKPRLKERFTQSVDVLSGQP